MYDVFAESWWSRLLSERTAEEVDEPFPIIFINRIFKIRARNTSIKREIKCGFYHFFSCCFILSVNPTLLANAGFTAEKVAVATALSAGLSCIFSGLMSNLPIVLSPTTSTSLYFSLYVQSLTSLDKQTGSSARFSV
jgi:AGZA family xanthine/uracil permease-like MFS transporter